MGKRLSKIVPPVIITLLVTLYCAGIGAVLLFFDLPFFMSVIGVMVQVASIGIIVFVLIQRVKEIRSGEEDDLSKY